MLPHDLIEKCLTQIDLNKSYQFITVPGENWSIEMNHKWQSGDEYLIDCVLRASLDSKFQESVQRKLATLHPELTEVYLPNEEHTIRFTIHVKKGVSCITKSTEM